MRSGEVGKEAIQSRYVGLRARGELSLVWSGKGYFCVEFSQPIPRFVSKEIALQRETMFT